jgi:peptide/nickel transport system permease protein
MLAFILKRLGWAVVTLVGVTLITFLVVYRLPADPAALLAGPSAPPEVVENIRKKHRMDRPMWEQYGTFLLNAVRGDLGESYSTGEDVSRAIARALPATARLAVTGWACWLALGTLIGVWAAAKTSRLREGTLLAFSIIGVSTPTFWVGILLLYVFVTRLGWLPPGGSDAPGALVLPAVTLAFTGVAYYARLAHSTMTQALGEDYVRTARAKGVPPGRILFRHALRNALLPLVTVAGADLAALLGGVVFTESVFAWQGMGLLAVQAVGNLDIPIIMGVVLVSAAFVVVANLMVDLLYPLLDPRIRGGAAGAEG